MHVCLSNVNIHTLVRRYFQFVVPMCPPGLPPQIARFLWCMIRLDLCHGKSVKRLAAYISEYAWRTEVSALMHATIERGAPITFYSLRLITGRATYNNQTTAIIKTYQVRVNYPDDQHHDLRGQCRKLLKKKAILGSFSVEKPHQSQTFWRKCATLS